VRLMRVGMMGWRAARYGSRREGEGCEWVISSVVM
jgi:hypothetical protein